MHIPLFPATILRSLAFGLCMLVAVSPPGHAENRGTESFDDQPLEEPLAHPDWFKLSFLDLREDLQEAADSGKQGLILYFGQKYCPYCRALLEKDFGKSDIREYTRLHFDVISIDIHGNRPVTDLDGVEWTERSYSLHTDTHFTPTLIFYDTRGEVALRLPGYYPPYKFRAALEYVAGGHYRKEDFRSYLARANMPMVFEPGDLNYEDFFQPPPYALDRSRWPADRPLAVFFEQADCHACDILHTGPLQQDAIRSQLNRMDIVQLDLWGHTPVITPDGRHTTDGQWAEDLGLFYAPTLLFFDAQGDEIIRVDSVVQFYRLRNVLDYILSGAYLEFPNFQRWRDATRH